MFRTIFSIVILIGGLSTLIVVTAWTGDENRKNTVKIQFPDVSNYDQSYKLKLRSISQNNQKENIDKNLSLVRFIPEIFDTAACIDLERLRKFHWASMLFYGLQIKNVKQKFNSLGISINNIDAICAGFKSDYSFFSLSGGKVRLDLKPHIFLISGKAGRMEALRNYWHKTTSQVKEFSHGDFTLSFPLSSKNDIIAGSYKTDLKPVIALFNSFSESGSICRSNLCRNFSQNLGIFPNILFLSKPANYKLLPAIKLKSLAAGLEFNPDGFIIKIILESTGRCEENIKRLRNLAETIFTRYNLDINIPQRVNAICNDNRIIAMISMSSAEFYNQIRIMGLIKELSIN